MGLWSRLFGRPQAALSNKITTSRDLEQAWLEQGRLTFSGATITPAEAMRASAVASAVGILSETLAQVPLIVYRRLERGKERAPDHPAARLLGQRPNRFQDSFQWRELLMVHLALWGNAYALKLGTRGEVRELLPLHPRNVQVEQGDDWRMTYRVTLPDSRSLELPSDRVLHIRDRSLDGASGDSRVTFGREAIGLSLETERHGAKLFGNGARPSGVLTTEQSLTEDQVRLIAQSWKERFGGDNALSTAILDGGFKWQQMSLNSDDAQFLETRKFQIAEVSRLYRVPLHMLSDLDKSSFNNIEQQSLEFVVYSMLPWFRRWENAINTQVVDPAGEGEFFAEFLVDGLLRGDVKNRFEAYAIGLQNRIFNPNEIREMENRNPYDGGDEFMAPENIFGGGANSEDPDDEANSI